MAENIITGADAIMLILVVFVMLTVVFGILVVGLMLMSLIGSNPIAALGQSKKKKKTDSEVLRHIRDNYGRYSPTQILVGNIEDLAYRLIYQTPETLKMRNGLGLASEKKPPEEMYDFDVEIELDKYVLFYTHLFRASLVMILEKEEVNKIRENNKHKSLIGHGDDALVSYTSCFNQRYDYARCINDESFKDIKEEDRELLVSQICSELKAKIDSLALKRNQKLKRKETLNKIKCMQMEIKLKEIKCQ